MSKEPISLYTLCDGIKRYLAKRLKNNLLWVTAEISQISRSGLHYYLDLVENNGTKEIAKIRAVIWNSDYQRFRPKLKGEEDKILKTGSKVLLQIEVEYHVLYGINLIIRDVDLSYTLGELEQKRKETLRKLQELGLVELNKATFMPIILQKIAVIASPKTSGYADFVQHLTNNIYGYQFKTTLFPSSVQGAYAEQGIVTQLKQINRRHKEFDVVVMLRGGGAKLDLEAFNSFDIAQHIAALQLPMVTGIGHETDFCIADMMAHTYRKTPTAVADFIIEKAMIFESEMVIDAKKIARLTLQLLETTKLRLSHQSAQLMSSTQAIFHQQKSQLQYLQSQLVHLSKNKLSSENHLLDNLSRAIHLLNPENVLKRGYSLTLHKGKIVHADMDLNKGDKIITKTHQLTLESEIKKIENGKEKKS